MPKSGDKKPAGKGRAAGKRPRVGGNSKRGAPRRSILRERFAAEYLKDGNATQAAIRAGYATKAAYAQGHRALNDPKVAAAIAAGQKKILDLAEVTAVDVVRELARVGFADLQNFVEWGPDGVTLRDSSVLTEDQSPAVAEVGERINQFGTAVRIKLHGKVEALTQLGRKFGIFKDNIEVEAGERLRKTMDDASARLERRLAQLNAGHKRAEKGRPARG